MCVRACVMRISFIIPFMTDLYKDNHVRPCVRLQTFSLKKIPFRSFSLDFNQISQECSLDRG